MSKSYDLSTSSKWSALSDGEHTVQIVAKGTGYRDSAKSTSVTVTKTAATPIETWILKNQKPSLPSGNYLDLPIDTAVYAKSGTVYKWINYDEAREINGGINDWAIRYAGSCLYIGGYDTYGNPAIPVYDGKYDNKWIFGFWDDGVTESTAPTDTTNLRTIKFYSAPTGDLLTWLQANGKKQGV